MPAFLRRRSTWISAALIAAGLIATGCSASTSSPGAGASSARAAASSIAANPTVSQDLSQLESELLASYQKNFSAAHPITSMKTALHQVFPSASLSASATFAVDHLTTSMVGTKQAAVTARHAWAQLVVEHILAENPNATASPGSAVIPGATVPATAKSS